MVARLPQDLSDIRADVGRFLNTEDIEIESCRSVDWRSRSLKSGDGAGLGLVKIEDFVESRDL